jgi:hypothetical protein
MSNFPEADFRELKRHLSGYRTSGLTTELTPHSIEIGMRLISDKSSSQRA